MKFKNHLKLAGIKYLIYQFFCNKKESFKKFLISLYSFCIISFISSTVYQRLTNFSFLSLRYFLTYFSIKKFIEFLS